MASIRENLQNILFVPLPGLRSVPGISHLTGMQKLQEIERKGREQLNNIHLKEELQKIHLDFTIMAGADERDRHDRSIQALLFGTPVYNKTTDHFMDTPPDPALQPVMAAFTELEHYKRTVRNEWRPAMEKQLHDVLDAIHRNDRQLTPQLEAMLHDLQKTRLAMLTAREQMLDRRKTAYELVEAYMRGRNRPMRQTIDDAVNMATDSRRRDMPAAVTASQELRLTLEASHSTDDVLEAQVKQLYAKINALHDAGDNLKEKIDAEEKEQLGKIRRRAAKWATALGGIFIAALSAREFNALGRRYEPYASRIESYQRIDIDQEKQQLVIFQRPLKNTLDDTSESPNPPLNIRAHCVETDVKPEHGMATAMLMDLAYRMSTGNPNARADLGRVALHHSTQRSIELPLWESSYLVERRLHESEQMLTATDEHHVFNYSVTSDYPYSPGSGAARRERDFLLRLTCPVTMPSGNEMNDDDMIDPSCQHLAELSHYPRYSLQIGEVGFLKGTGHEPDSVYISRHNHPYPLASYAVPHIRERDIPHLADKLEIEGSSMASAGFGGELAGIKSIFPQLSWDNIIYAIALSCGKEYNVMPTYPGTMTSNSFHVHNPHNDITFSHYAGSGLLDRSVLSEILHNMLYQRTMHPGIENRPQVIVRDAMDSGKAATEHVITLPPDKDVFKITLDIVPPRHSKGAYITLSDEYGNSRKIPLADNQPITRFTDWSQLGCPGGTLTVTSSVPVRLGYVAHVNGHGAISLGVNHMDRLLSIDTVKEKIDPQKLKALPIEMPRTPEVIQPQQRAAMGR